MVKITALRPVKGRGKRMNVYIDGKFAFSLDNYVVASEKVKVEQELSEEQIAILTRADNFQRCLNTALHFLGYRPRSEYELRDRLNRGGFTADTQEAVINGLKEKGYIDDLAFARFWQDNRQSFSPRSILLTRMELKKKGVSESVINQVVDAADDAECAYRAALSKVRSITLSDYQSYHRRIGGYLKRRGFGYEVINKTVKRTWQELTDRNPEPDGI